MNEEITKPLFWKAGHVLPWCILVCGLYLVWVENSSWTAQPVKRRFQPASCGACSSSPRS